MIVVIIVIALDTINQKIQLKHYNIVQLHFNANILSYKFGNSSFKNLKLKKLDNYSRNILKIELLSFYKEFNIVDRTKSIF